MQLNNRKGIHMSKTKVDAHYYPSLCFRALKRLGFAGKESTGEDGDMAEQLAEVGESFNFAPPMAGGPIFTLVYQMPGYLAPEQPDQMMEIFKRVGCFVETGEIQHILEEFPQKTREWGLWYTEPLLDAFLHPLEGREQDVLQLVDLFSGYLQRLWPQYRDEFDQWLDDFDLGAWEEHLQIGRVIDVWEAVAETSYPYSGFTMVACPETPSTASSLGPDKIVLGARHGIEVARNSLVHEIGVRMPGLHRLAQHPDTAQLMAKDYVGMLRLLEAESCFRKHEVMHNLGWEYDADQDGFLSGMDLHGLVELRTEISASDDLYEMFAEWYRQASSENLL